MLSELAVQMKVVLNPSKPATFEADFTNASAGPRPYFSGLKPHHGGSVRIGYLILYGLQDSALRCVLAHELAHIKKKHSIVLGILVLVLIGGVVVSAMYSGNIILFLLVILVGAAIISVLSWYDEYQADSVAAKVVGSTEMASALRQVSALLNRGKDSFTHPSFEKRISSLTGSDKD
jgi:Zn-dependent protease with chaperone function